jgi:hypothetical protein
MELFKQGYVVPKVKDNIPSPSELRRMADDMMRRLDRLIAEHTVYHIIGKEDTLEFLRVVSSETDEKNIEKGCDLFPAPNDSWVRNRNLLSAGNYGQTYVAELTGKCLKTLDPRLKSDKNAVYLLPAVVKESIPSARRADVNYQNMLHEILINQTVIRTQILEKKSNNFALMYAFILCDVDRSDKHFCSPSALPIGKYKREQLDERLRRGDMALFPVFEKVTGCSLYDFMKKEKFDMMDFDLMYSILKQLFLSLDEANAKGVYTHNDLHEHNIIVDIPSDTQYVYHSSDGETRVVEPRVRAIIIDQGQASASYTTSSSLDTHKLALYKHTGADCSVGCLMGTDMFHLLVGLYREVERNSWCEKLIRKWMHLLFGADVFAFLEGDLSLQSSFPEYLVYCQVRQPSETFRKVLGLTYLEAINHLDVVYTDLMKTRRKYSSKTVQSYVYSRAKRHFINNKYKEKLRELKTAIAEHRPGVEALVRDVDREIDEDHELFRKLPRIVGDYNEKKSELFTGLCHCVASPRDKEAQDDDEKEEKNEY